MLRLLPVLLFAACFGPVPPAAAAPLAFAPAAVDFGVQNQHRHLAAAVELTNRADTPLRITGIEADCSCTVPELAQRLLAPGQSTTLHLHFETRAFVGPIRRHVTVTTDHGPSILAVQAEVRPYADWDLGPLPAALPPSRVGTTAESRLLLHHRGRPLARPTAVSADQPWLEPRLEPSPDPTRTTLVLHKRADAPAGHLSATVTVQTESTVTPALQLQVAVPVHSGLRLDRNPVALPRTAVGSPSTGRFAVLDWPADAPPPRVTAPGATLRPLGQTDGAWHFELTVTPAASGARFIPIRVYRDEELLLDAHAVVRAHAAPE